LSQAQILKLTFSPSLSPSSLSQISSYTKVSFSDPACGGDQDRYLWISFIFLVLCWFVSVASQWDYRPCQMRLLCCVSQSFVSLLVYHFESLSLWALSLCMSTFFLVCLRAILPFYI
jgi:hypothetical protein